jgi:hypothetical protein
MSELFSPMLKVVSWLSHILGVSTVTLRASVGSVQPTGIGSGSNITRYCRMLVLPIVAPMTFEAGEIGESGNADLCQLIRP